MSGISTPTAGSGSADANSTGSPRPVAPCFRSPVKGSSIVTRRSIARRSSEQDRGAVKEPVLCVQLEPRARAASHTRIRDDLLALGSAHPMTKDIRTFLFHRSFPVDVRHNAKILSREAGDLGRKGNAMKALVTGGGGSLGGAIVRKLRKRGWDVRSFSRGAYPALDAIGVETFRGDLARRQDVERACDGCDIIFHVAAKADLWGPYQDFYQANVVGTENILEAARRSGICKDRIYQFSQRRFQRPGHGRGRRIRSLSGTLQISLSRDESNSGKARAGGELPEPRDGCLASSLDLGTRGHASRPGNSGAWPEFQADRYGGQARGFYLYRRCGRSASARG